MLVKKDGVQVPDEIHLRVMSFFSDRERIRNMVVCKTFRDLLNDKYCWHRSSFGSRDNFIRLVKPLPENIKKQFGNTDFTLDDLIEALSKATPKDKMDYFVAAKCISEANVRLLDHNSVAALISPAGITLLVKGFINEEELMSLINAPGGSYLSTMLFGNGFYFLSGQLKLDMHSDAPTIMSVRDLVQIPNVDLVNEIIHLLNGCSALMFGDITLEQVARMPSRLHLRAVLKPESHGLELLKDGHFQPEDLGQLLPGAATEEHLKQMYESVKNASYKS